MSDALYVGMDIAKAQLDIATVPPSTMPSTVAHDEGGIATLRTQLQTRSVALIVVEATGGWERDVVSALALAGLPIAVVNPRQVRDFAKALGHLAKTDQIDARVLAEFAARVRPTPRPLPDDAHRELEALVNRRHQLLDMLTAERHRVQTVHRSLHRDLRAHIGWLEKRIAQADTDISQRLRDSPVWRVTDDLLQSTPGIGPQSSARLIVSLPELGRLSGRAIAKLVGVAPLNRDSGTRRGPRVTWGGRADVRRTLYMATVVASQHNPVIRAFYQRLRAAGKPAMVALIASMRKLLTILNAMIKQQRPWTSIDAIGA
jgi:transposase